MEKVEMRVHQGLRTALMAGLAVIAVAAMPSDAGAQSKTHPAVQMTTASPTGSWFPTGAAIGDLANQQFEGQPISVIPGAGAIGNITRVGKGKSDMGLSYAPFLTLAQRGHNNVNPDEGFKNLRAIMSLTPYPLHILAADESGVASLEDIGKNKGKIRLASEVTGSSIHFIVQTAFEKYGAPLDSIKAAGGSIRQVNTAGRKDAWKNRQVDMAVFMFDPPHPVIQELMRVRSSQLLGFSGQVLEDLKSELGFLTYQLTPDHYPDQKKAVTTIGMPTLLFGTAELGDDLVYEMCKQVANNKERMVKAVATFKSWNPEDMANGLGIEIHPGAKRFYKEMGWL